MYIMLSVSSTMHASPVPRCAGELVCQVFPASSLKIVQLYMVFGDLGVPQHLAGSTILPFFVFIPFPEPWVFPIPPIEFGVIMSSSSLQFVPESLDRAIFLDLAPFLDSV